MTLELTKEQAEHLLNCFIEIKELYLEDDYVSLFGDTISKETHIHLEQMIEGRLEA